MSGMLYSIPVILTGYRIVQIEDEATPLAQAAKSGYYGDTVAGMLGIGVLLLLVIYFILCRKYQKRIIELQENAHPGWNWWKLRKQVTELEDKKAEGIVEDIRRAAQSYVAGSETCATSIGKKRKAIYESLGNRRKRPVGI